MNSPNIDAEIEAARAYEAFFVPALFAPWAPVVADAADLSPGQDVLDVACGTGVLAREAERRTGPDGYVAGLDPGAGMLAVAAGLAPGVDWRRGAAESIPFPDGRFDAVACQFGFMFMDGPRAVGEMLRVLRPGGRLAVAVWDRAENIPAYAREIELLDRIAGRAAADALRAPFALGEKGSLAAVFEDAGADPVAVATRRGPARFDSVRAMVEADLRGWLPVMGVDLDEDTIGRVLAEAGGALAGFVTDEGTVAFETAAHVVTAVKP